ncbi:hypothetical protein GQ44DRAFT_310479 [Phaeosphaeriaceae sp. PMI808]|nr:hypothetical protein GQ44DRAFT_310479 [Phaeosphaeriaceae sp. PMI808]
MMHTDKKSTPTGADSDETQRPTLQNQQSHMVSRVASAQYSSDPFAPNYRHICPWTKEERAAELAPLAGLVRPDLYEVYESAEYAEYTRPHDQLMILLRERGLEESYQQTLYGNVRAVDGTIVYNPEGTEDERRERTREVLRSEGASDLLERAESFWQLQEGRYPVYGGENPVEDLLKTGDIAGYRWIKMNPDMIRRPQKHSNK